MAKNLTKLRLANEWAIWSIATTDQSLQPISHIRHDKLFGFPVESDFEFLGNSDYFDQAEGNGPTIGPLYL